MITLALVLDKPPPTISGILETMPLALPGSCTPLCRRFSPHRRSDGKVWGTFLLWAICNVDSSGCTAIPPGNIFRFCPERLGCPTLFPTLSIITGDDDEERCVVDGGNVVEKTPVDNVSVTGTPVTVTAGTSAVCTLGSVTTGMVGSVTGATPGSVTGASLGPPVVTVATLGPVTSITGAAVGSVPGTGFGSVTAVALGSVTTGGVASVGSTLGSAPFLTVTIGGIVDRLLNRVVKGSPVGDVLN